MQLEDQAKRVTRAREELIFDCPWYGMPSMRLGMIEDPAVNTMCTDGQVIRWNPTWVAGCTNKRLKTTIAHEVAHCLYLHMFRMDGKDHDTWNQATDYVINGHLKKDSNMDVGGDWLYDPQFDGWNAERVYAFLRNQQQKNEDNGTPNPEKGQGPGDISPAPAPSDDQSNTEGDWAIAAEESTSIARKAGVLPSGAAEQMKAEHMTPDDWKQRLAEFVQNLQPSDYTFMRPNRRFIWQGMILPGLLKESLPYIGIAVDTSGSTSALRRAFAAHVSSIAKDARPEYIRVVYCDSKVQGEQTFEPDDEITMNVRGGGGTALQPAIDAFRDDPPACLIYLTDYYSSDIPQDPGYPVLWAVPAHLRPTVTFGEVVGITV